VGLSWYDAAYLVADTFAVKHGLSIQQTAGVLAAVSPLNSWGANVNLAARILDAGGLTSGYIPLGLRKADAILAGADVRATLNGAKITNFYDCIVLRGQTDAVCVDRHAFDLAVNVRHTEDTRPTLGSGKRYNDLVSAYQRAAVILSRGGERVYAAQVQAVTWVTWRQRFWAAGAFDLHAVVA
jgi:hypothetical protein